MKSTPTNQNRHRKSTLLGISALALSCAASSTVFAVPTVSVQDERYYEIAEINLNMQDFVVHRTGDGREIDEAVGEEQTVSYTQQSWQAAQTAQHLRREQLLRELGIGSSHVSDPASLAQIINFGATMWKLVEANKPVVNFNNLSANALPATTEGNWLALENWQTPKGKVYGFVYKNHFGMEVANFEYRILFSPGGSYNGAGQYLNNVSVTAKDLSVGWAYNFEANATVANVLNTASKQNPLAGMELLVEWKVKTVVRESRSSMSFFVKGDGTYLDLNGPH